MVRPMFERPGLVIFDCDGVLVDTEKVANELLVRMLADVGHVVTYEESRKRFVGRMMEDIQCEVERALGRSLGEDWSTFVKDETVKVLQSGVEPIEGVGAQIERLREIGFPYCVASSGRLVKMRASLGSAGLLPLLEDVLFSAQMVGRGKPAPDLFLHAAEAMGHVPQNCVVIEDSVPGVQAGIAAGMRVLGYVGDPHTDGAALAGEGAHVFSDMRELGVLLGLGR